MTKKKKILFSIVSLIFSSLLLYLYLTYRNVDTELKKTYKDIETNRVIKSSENDDNNSKEIDPIKQTEPFSILLLGVDTGTHQRTSTWEGNSDTMILVTINPVTKKTTLTSLQRDMLVTLAGPEGNPMNNVRSKLNSAYQSGGAQMAIMTIQEALDLKIDKYALINMQGLVDLVNAVGGIEVTNSFDFPIQISRQEPEYTAIIEPGTHLINGDQALVYARMRYDDPKGDYGRQLRQQEVIKKVVEKLLTINSISNYNKILTSITKNTQTNLDLSISNLKNLMGYKDASQTIESYQIIGENINMGDGISYQIPREYTILDTQNRIKKELGLLPNDLLTSTLLTVEDIYGSSILRNENTELVVRETEVPNPVIETVVEYEEVVLEE